MMYITYFVSEEDMRDFISYDRSREVVVIDPVLESMINFMEMDTKDVRELKMSQFNDKHFFDEYLSENRPVILRQYAKDWLAMQKWGDLDYLLEVHGEIVSRLFYMQKEGYDAKVPV